MTAKEFMKKQGVTKIEGEDIFVGIMEAYAKEQAVRFALNITYGKPQEQKKVEETKELYDLWKKI